MGNLIRKYWYLTAVALLCFASSALADTVNVTYTGPGGNNLGGVYVYPYNLSINGAPSTPAICDDFVDDIYGGESWTAKLNTFSAVTSDSTLWGDNPSGYEEATWLAAQLFHQTVPCPTGGNCQADINYAIWAIFYPAALGNLNSDPTNYANAVWWEGQAVANGQTGGLHGFEILTPDPNDGPGKGGPQEFLYSSPPVTPLTPPLTPLDPTSTPEAPTSVLLGAGVLALLALMVVFRRGQVRTAL
ncbi:MAG: hypothetical protein ABSA59_08505 [Terriglobia bacterium]